MIRKIGIIKEGKTPPDERVPLTPSQVAELQHQYKSIEWVVQKSDVRTFSDQEYKEKGIQIVDKLDDCDVIFGVKEVNIQDLIPNKHFFFFSHTIKKQPYNRALLNAIVNHKIQLTDYEVLTDKRGNRLIGFGRYAGIVGCYNGFRTFGLKHKLYDLKPAHQCFDRAAMEDEMSKIILPKDFKMVLTGFGRVGNGAREIVDLLPIKEVSSESFLNDAFDGPVFTHLNVDDYNERIDGKAFNRNEFYKSGEGHVSTFPKYLEAADLYVACHFWKDGSPFLFTKNDLRNGKIRMKVIADISCDIDGPVASTIRPSTIANPIYGYDINEGVETDFQNENAIAVMAVDNLPCELPKDASEDFGNELMTAIIPALLENDPDDIILRGTETTKNGELSEKFKYLQAYLEGKE